jgi:hypothetical protein
MRTLFGLVAVSCLNLLSLACTGGTADNSDVIKIPNDIGWTPPVTGAAGTAGTGGAAGAGGSSGAATGDSGAPDPRTDINLVWPSSGCGQPLPADQVPTVPGERTGYTKRTVMQMGDTLAGNDPIKAVPRDIFIRVPADYDPNRAYQVVYVGMGCGTGTADTGTYPLFAEERGGNEQAIYVGVSLPVTDPDTGLGPNGQCYDNRAGENSMEWEAFELFHTLVESTYCVDNNRVFISGYSTGGWLANMWGCYFAGLPDPPRQFAPNFRIRGQAAATGNQPNNNPTCNGPVAGFWLHDEADASNTIQGNYDGRDRVLEMNGCVGSPTEPWGEGDLAGICERYVDCPAEYPVIFCTTTGYGHSDQPTNAIPGFTQFFALMAPATP